MSSWSTSRGPFCAEGQEVIETPFDPVYQYAGAFGYWRNSLVRVTET